MSAMSMKRRFPQSTIMYSIIASTLKKESFNTKYQKYFSIRNGSGRRFGEVMVLLQYCCNWNLKMKQAIQSFLSNGAERGRRENIFSNADW